MLKIAATIFLLLHGVVHLWYVILSNGWVEVEEAMGWNGYSWLLSPVLPSGTVLSLASVLYVIVTVGFAAGAIGYWFGNSWATNTLAAAAVLSTVVIIAMWDGRPDRLVEKGLVGVVINLGVFVLLFR